MMPINIIHSNDFLHTSAYLNHGILTLKGIDGKKYRYILDDDISYICAESQDTTTKDSLLTHISKNMGMVGAGLLLGAGAVLPALGSAWAGHTLATHTQKTTTTYLVNIVFWDGKQAILQTDQKHFDKLQPYIKKLSALI